VTDRPSNPEHYTLLDLFRTMVEEDASDLFVKAGVRPMFRIAGRLRPSEFAPPSPQEAEALADGILSEKERQTLRQAGHADFAYWEAGLGRFRVNVYRQRGAIALVARRVKQAIPSFAALHLPDAVADLALAPRGLVLVTGPTGSGKSTTLAAMVDYRNRHAPGHIITIEDPIEYLHEDRPHSFVSQREVGTDTESFAAALHDALRQSPDVLLIGEMRDADSVTSAVYFAETGHLVLSSLHSINASQALDRIIHFFPQHAHDEIRIQLSVTLAGIVAQRLVPRADGAGLVPAVEVLLATQRVREAVRKGEFLRLPQIMAEGQAEGMQTFDDSLFALCGEGLVARETAVEAADRPNDLRMRLHGIRSRDVGVADSAV